MLLFLLLTSNFAEAGCGDAGSCRACMTFNSQRPKCGWINDKCLSKVVIPDATQAVFSDCSKAPPTPTCSDHSSCADCVQDLRDYDTDDGTKVKRACDYVFGTCVDIEDPVTASWRVLHTSASYDCPAEEAVGSPNCGDAASCRACMTFNKDSNPACGWMHERCLPKVVIPDTMQAIFSDCSNPPPTPTCSDHSSCESCVQDLRDYETDDGTKVKRACDYDVSGTCVDIADPLTASWRTLHTSASYDCPVEEAVGKKGPNCGDAGSCRACMTFNKGSNPACGWINQRCVSEAAIPDATQAVFSDCSKPPPTCSDLHSTCESCVQDLRDYETEDGTKVKRACDWVFGTCNNIEDPVTTSWRLLHTSASYDCPVEKEPEECVDNLDKLRKDLYDDEATCASAIKSYGDMICSNTLFSPLCCATCAALSSAREEAVGVAVRSAPHQTPSLVTAFAALGLVATLYGAYQHYVSK